jgi:hypothetical protein
VWQEKLEHLLEIISLIEIGGTSKSLHYYGVSSSVFRTNWLRIEETIDGMDIDEEWCIIALLAFLETR